MAIVVGAMVKEADEVGPLHSRASKKGLTIKPKNKMEALFALSEFLFWRFGVRHS